MSRQQRRAEARKQAKVGKKANNYTVFELPGDMGTLLNLHRKICEFGDDNQKMESWLLKEAKATKVSF